MSLKEQRAKQKQRNQEKKAQRRGELTPADKLVNQGTAYAKQALYDQALECYNQAIQLNPKLAEAYVNRGNFYRKQENYSQALADYNQAIQLNPQYAAAYANRGNLYAEQKNFPQALADYNQAIQLNPKLAEAYVNRGLIYAEQKNFPQALADYNQAIQLNPKLAAAYANRGFAHLDLENTEAAFADLDKFIEYSEDNELKQQIALVAHSVALSNNEFSKARDYVEQAFAQAATETKQHQKIYLDNIEKTEALYNKTKELEETNKKLAEAHKKQENLLREFTHMLGSTLFPETLLDIANTLKEHSTLQEQIKRLYDAYHAELTVRRQSELLRVRYFTDSPHRFIELVTDGCIKTDSEDAGSNVLDVFESALERVIARLLSEHYDKLKTPRGILLQLLKTDVLKLRNEFKAHVFLENKPLLDWINSRLMPVSIQQEPSAWDRVRFKIGGTTESLFYSYFNELLLNAIKYADYTQGLVVRFYQQYIDETLYLCFSIENTSRVGIVSGSQIGLKSLRKNLAQLNSADTPEKILQVQQEQGRFKVTLAILKDILLYEPTAEDDEAIPESFRRGKALRQQHQAV